MSALNTDLTLLNNRIDEVYKTYDSKDVKLRDTIYSGKYDKKSESDYFRGLAGLGDPGVINTRGVSPETTNSAPHSLTVQTLKYGLQVRLGEDYAFWDKNMYNLGTELGTQIGKSWEWQKEQVAANVLNRGFTTVANGGTPIVEASTAFALFSASHAAIDGSLIPNLSTAALSLDSVSAAILQARYARDLNGRRYRTSGGFVLHIPPALEPLAKRLLYSAMDPGTANNSVNPLTAGSKDTNFVSYVVNEYLAGTTRWFVMPADKSERKIYQIEENDSGVQYEKLGAGTNGDHVWDRRMRLGAFAARYQGLVGSNA
jgi:hypothetical protein